MPAGTPLTFEEVCTHVGRLFLESQHELKAVNQQSQTALAELQARLEKAERERDEAVKAFSQSLSAGNN